MINHTTIHKKPQAVALILLFACLVLYGVTSQIIFLFLPFIVLFLLVTAINWKFSYWILIFSIPISIHLVLADGALSTSFPDEPLMWIFLLLFTVIFAYNPRIIPEWWWRNPIVLVIILQVLWLIVSVIYSKETLISVKFLAAKCWFLVSFFILPVIIFGEKKDFKKGFWLLLIPLLLTMLIINIRHAIYGLSFEQIENAIRPLYYNHVEYSTVISMFFPVVFIAFLMVKWEQLSLKLTLLFLVLFFLPAIYLTYARAAMLAVIFAIMVYIAIRLKLANIIMPGFFAIVVLVMVFVTHNNKYIEFRPDYQHTYMHRDFEDHMIATFKGTDMSSMERIYRWIAAIRMSNDRPIVGYGPNSFYQYYKPYALPMFRTYVSRNEEKSTTHNYFLFMLVGQGWPAMLLYAVLLVVVFAQAQKTYYRFKDPFYKKTTLALIMMFGACFVNNFFSELIETHKVGALFYLAMGLLVLLDRKSRKEINPV